jgi:uncharacterized membrane protein
MALETSKLKPKNWHARHQETMTIGQQIADMVAGGMGSWTFIIGQTIFVSLWIILNFVGYIYKWDPYPFILLNLLFSTQAAYSAPIIMMAQNRQADRDRVQAEEDYKTNVKAKKEIEDLQKMLSRIELEKLDKILNILEKSKS